jgi:hypothetical protein
LPTNLLREASVRSFGPWKDKVLDATTSRRRAIRRGGYAHGGLVVCVATAALLSGVGLAQSGPCTAQIAALERQISPAIPSPNSGPTGPQTLGAQLHYQPTPRDVEHAEEVANKAADAALARARKADAEGNADACNEALRQARRLYGIDD